MLKILHIIGFVLFFNYAAFSQKNNLPELPKITLKKQIKIAEPPTAQRFIQDFEFKIEKYQSFDYELYLRNFRSYKSHVLRHTI